MKKSYLFSLLVAGVLLMPVTNAFANENIAANRDNSSGNALVNDIISSGASATDSSGRTTTLGRDSSGNATVTQTVGYPNVDALFGGPKSNAPLSEAIGGNVGGPVGNDVLIGDPLSDLGPQGDDIVVGTDASDIFFGSGTGGRDTLFGGPETSPANDHRDRNFDHAFDMGPGGGGALPLREFDTLNANFITEGADGFRPDSAGGRAFLNSVNTNDGTAFGPGGPASDFFVLDGTSHEASTYCN